jgi:membrane dipeptidase
VIENIVIDCHSDTLLKKYYEQHFLIGEKEQIFHVSKDLLLQGGIDIQVFAIFVPPKLEKLGVEISLEMIAIAKEMENNGFFIIKSSNELLQFNQKKKNSKIGMILSLEGAVALERNQRLLPIFYELGIRLLGLTWSRKNLFCEGTDFSQENISGEGLSRYGLELVEMLDNLGIVIDISHLNREGVADVVKNTKNPFIASHSNCYKLCSNNRNLSDDQLFDIASAEGVVGINFYPRFLTKKNATVYDVIRHINYVVDLIGVNYVGIGSDFDGIGITPEGLENAGKIKTIPLLLEGEGFNKQDISKIMGRNFQRVFRKVWK